MNHKMLRQQAAQLARECRAIDRLGQWSIREWNHSVRRTVEIFMVSTIRFHKIHGTWEN